MEENTPDTPIPDGGGLTRTLTGDATRCANVPRTFLNEENCVISDSPTSCGSAGTPNLMIELNDENIIQLNNMTGQYLYAISGLPLRDVDGITQPSPCVPGLLSRWEIDTAASCVQTAMGTQTNTSLFELLLEKGTSDMNPNFRDIYFPSNGARTCDQADIDNLVEAEIIIGDQCFRRVHPEQ